MERRRELTRNLPHRLQRLEVRAKEIAAARSEPHTLCFINMDMRVVSTFGVLLVAAAFAWLTPYDSPVKWGTLLGAAMPCTVADKRDD